MITTIKINKETQERLLALDLAAKGKTYDMIINELINSYERQTQEHKQLTQEYKASAKQWKKEMEKSIKNRKIYEQEQAMWQRLLKWAKKQGFKG